MNFLVYLVLSIVSKLIASVREFGVGFIWGAGSIVDAFILAMMLPMFFIDIASVMFNSTYIGVYVNSGNKDRKLFFKDVFCFTSIYVLLTTIIVILFLKIYIIYSEIPIETKHIIDNILIYVVIYYSLLVYCEFYKAHLMACEKQKMMPLPMIFANIIFISTMYYFSADANDIALVSCFAFSSVVQFILYIPLIIKKDGISIINSFDSHSRYANKNLFLKNFVPVFFNAAVNQSSKITDKVIASSLIIGSLSSLYFAQQLYALYVNIIIVSILSFAYPKICKKANENKYELSSYIVHVIIVLFILLVYPLMLGLRYAQDIFKLILVNSTPQNIKLVSEMFVVLLSVVIFESISASIKRAFWALNKMKVTVYISGFTVISNIILSILLSSYYGPKGLVYSYCIVTVLSTMLLIFCFNKVCKITIPKNSAHPILISSIISVVFYILLGFFKIELDKPITLLIPGLIVVLGMSILFVYSNKNIISKVLKE
ncbi:polysaccharide biosynthesis C-terminal domain-containing protein [Escherichia albertii]|nr:polysaccharide biosynthesis C-terminal domain-containing protein [Escherichia albertii]MCZ9114889.1 polysaccharide biosynthesis C-terminal domain-containing protein [Escherichia albertii]MCZ9194918.1 polysaccharide biosynthesis C-terminal domain-containing protein [Escherichia albertii]MCZ9214643.1 polysaccharide biosynthesis C-terminal domain-containing protein [Escherichia albertii]MCZ9223678.1 polysaccharide biosynthesis C-terminal domain-containing protein [Escherichia albertii]